jgi:thiamine biosynthesis lipoprotein ApbE
LLSDRVDGAIVNAGGDLRTLRGEAQREGWRAEVEGPVGALPGRAESTERW